MRLFLYKYLYNSPHCSLELVVNMTEYAFNEIGKIEGMTYYNESYNFL